MRRNITIRMKCTGCHCRTEGLVEIRLCFLECDSAEHVVCWAKGARVANRSEHFLGFLEKILRPLWLSPLPQDDAPVPEERSEGCHRRSCVGITLGECPFDLFQLSGRPCTQHHT